MSVSMARWAIFNAILEEYASGSHGVTLLTFPSGQCLMPLLDAAGASYLTSVACFPMIRGKDELPPNASLPNHMDPIKKYGDGWIIGFIQIALSWDAVKLAAELEKMKVKLLEAANG